MSRVYGWSGGISGVKAKSREVGGGGVETGMNEDRNGGECAGIWGDGGRYKRSTGDEYRKD